jgi:hypothetical protein
MIKFGEITITTVKFGENLLLKCFKSSEITIALLVKALVIWVF